MTDHESENRPASNTALPAWRADLEALYEELDHEVRSLSPTCDLSGRCCRFQEYGHTLFVSEPEVQFLLSGAPVPSRPLDQGATCPWQDRLGRCTAREVRPLGCRVYFCDPAYQAAANSLSERFIGQLKLLTDRLSLPWNYAPMHHHLEAARALGRLQIDLAVHDPEEEMDRGPGDRREAPGLLDG